MEFSVFFPKQVQYPSNSSATSFYGKMMTLVGFTRKKTIVIFLVTLFCELHMLRAETLYFLVS